jgi:uncharacterized protein DUF6603
MAEAKPPSTTDLLLLIAGLQLPKSPDTTADFGEDYYLNEPGNTEERTLRESLPNPLWLRNPKSAWDSVRFRDWLIATLAANIASHKQEFTAISEPMLISLDVLSKEFKRGMAGITNEISELLITKSNRERHLFSALAVGISKHRIDGKEVFTFGAGMRRRASLWLNSQEALQADVEFFVPFSVLPSSSHPPQATFPNARSICAGIVIRKSNDTAIGRDENNKELIAMRFNFRIPFTTHWRSTTKSVPEDFVTSFGVPEIQIQKKIKDGATIGDWEKFGGWKDFLGKFVERPEVGDLLNTPVGPLLIAKVSTPGGVSDIILKQKKRDEIKTDLKDVKQDLDDQLALLKNISDWKPPKKDAVGPHSTQRKLGSLLESLGFISAKQGSGGEFEYSFKMASGVTVWTVLDRLLDELDGFPLWVKGLKPKTDREPRIALSLASQTNLVDPTKTYFGLAGLAYNIPLTPVPKNSKDSTSESDEVKTPTITLSDDNFTKDKSIFIDEELEQEEKESGGDNDAEPKPPEDGPQSTVEVLLHLGKWMSGETLDDNWFKRLLPSVETAPKPRVPLPGIRLLPIKRLPVAKRQEAIFDWTLLIDLLSLGIDIQGTTKDGLKFVKGLAGHFGLGAVEIRLALKFSLEDIRNEKSFFERVAIGVGFKLKDLRLSFGAPEPEKKKEKGSGNEIIEGLQDLLADDWIAVPAPEKGPEQKMKTRLSAKKKDKFSISVGYLTPLKPGSHGTLDIQLYDEKGNRGKMALIPIDRFADPIYLRQIGIGLRGVENLELDKGLPDKAQLTVSLTGGFRLPVFEMGFIGAKLSFPLNNPVAFQFALEGLDVSLKIGDVIISGSFFKSGIEYAGSLTVDVPKASFSAMGFYGPLRVFDMSRDEEIFTQLNLGKVHKKLLTKLTEVKITPAAVNRGHAPGEWELVASDNTRYTISDDADKLNLLGLEKTFFVFAMLTAKAGAGITAGPIQFTGVAFGYGYNRRLKVPPIENVAEFPLVQLVMGEGGFQEDQTDLISQLGKPVEDPVSALAKMKDHLIAERGKQFACAGVRFTIASVIDCFALLVVQWGGGEFEISLLGLARFRHTRDASAHPICYVEMQVLMSIKPSEGTFKLQALLTSNSWIINTDCKLTGGFALFVWFGGEHKGDMVLTLGGYHPRFRRPEHYPIVPRLGLNWPVNNNLSIKGGVYLAITPSCLMVGGKLEATFNSGRISAWFTVYLDVVVNWEPFYFEAELGISLRVEAALFLTSIKLTIGASIKMWGPPVGGIAHIDLAVVSFDIDFGRPKTKDPELIGTWQQFCHKFLNMSGGDRRAVSAPVKAFSVVQPNLAAGRNNLNTIPNNRRKDSAPEPEDAVWKVRADELELSAAAVVPVTTLNVGQVKTAGPSDGIQSPSLSGQPMMVTKAVALVSSGIPPKNSVNKLGAHPMGRKLQSVLNATVVCDDASAPQPELTGWTVEEEIGSVPAALWNADTPTLSPEPDAKLIAGCITGIKRLKPRTGKFGKGATPPPVEWVPLEASTVVKSETTQESPASTRSRNIQTVMAQKQEEQKKIAVAFAAAGFSLSWKTAPEVRFRELQADPLAGSVAAL